MSYTVNRFIEQAFLNAFANEVIADSKGDLFTVRAVSVGSDDGLEIILYDRHHNQQTNDAWMKAYGGLSYPVEERRLLNLRDLDAMPTIINLAWDKAAKTWVPILPRHERDNKPHPLNLP
jgi:hypothetical protein